MNRMPRGLVLAGTSLSMVSLVMGSVTYAAANTSTSGYPNYTQKATITYWSWDPNAKTIVSIFEKKYPNIKVNYQNIGGGAVVYPKFSTAIQAGTGAPDVVMIEYPQLPEFVSTGGLMDLTSYLKPFKNDFPSWVLNQVTFNNKVYGVPQDVGSLGLLYQKPLLAKSGLKTPTTWSQFEQEALQFHKKNPGKYFSYFSANDGGWITSLLWQAGVNPVQPTAGGGYKVNFDTPQAVKVLSMWKKLINAGAVESAADWSPQWEKSLSAGKYAVLVGSTWFPGNTLVPFDTNYKKQGWQVTMMPQWNAGSIVDGNWGGSADVVSKQSKYPQAAALFATFMNTNMNELADMLKPAASGGEGIYPADSKATTLSAFNAPDPALSGQTGNKDVFSKETAKVDANFQWSPWSDYTFNQMTTELPKAFSGKESFDQALKTITNNIVKYGKSQGFPVSS